MAPLNDMQFEKGRAFRALHEGAGAFLIPNPWDVGTARLLAQLGFQALATTSAGYAFSVGRRDGAIRRDETMAHLRTIVSATKLPVSADLASGFGETPEDVAQTYGMAAETGAVGASIEDLSGSILDIGLAAERVRAAAEAVHALPFPFTLTGRAENYLHGRPDLNDTIKRLQAYQEAGADVLYAPGLTTKYEIAAVVSSVDRPVNALASRLTVAELSELGVKRISVGSALSRAALGAFLRASKEMRDLGTFTFAEEAFGYADLNAMF